MLQVEIVVSLDMLLNTYENDTSQTDVCTGKIGSCYSFAQTEIKSLVNLFNCAAIFETHIIMN